ncbi:MAG: PLP-dependent lyase/thiolase [Candidatus Magasanikbacteria bacterium]|nr:PLP-dependent lyase/thiolase [Candidatus Magasanikbacteria bacterium]
MKTPQLPYPKLSRTLGIPSEVWFKREDLHKYGSHKGRSLPLMIDTYRQQGITDFIIASSGNAALAAARYIQTKNKGGSTPPLTLQMLVGAKIDPAKLRLLTQTTDDNITLEQREDPLQTAFKLEQTGPGKWLRQSADELALVGYYELAGELAKIPQLSAIFIPTSSGTTAQGLYEGCRPLKLNPQIHIIQTDYCHPMVEKEEKEKSESSLAKAIVDRVARRKAKVQEAIKNSGGAGWIATDAQISAAMKLVKEQTGLIISPNSALSMVGLQQAIAAGWRWEGAVVCLITGA